MYYLHHTHQASASTQALLVELENKRYICSVQHTYLRFHSLDQGGQSSAASSTSGGGSEGLTLPLNARIIKAIQRQPNGPLLILTDHHQPRIIAAERRRGQWKTRAVVQVEELGRQPAETGITFDVFDGQESKITEDDEGAGTGLLFAHTHAGVLKAVPLEAKKEQQAKGNAEREGLLPQTSAAFTVRTPHPHLIHSLFLDDASRPEVALLSLSSIPSRLPGLGMQCLPVLSFHWFDTKAQELKPLPWGPSPKPLPPPQQVSSEQGVIGEEGEEEIRETMPGSFGQGQEARGGNGTNNTSRRSGGGGGRGPSAMGATKSAEQTQAAEEALAASSLARAHVPLPYADALGAHLLLALPASVGGGGVLVFSETSILLIPPPPSSSRRQQQQQRLGDASKSPTSPTAASGQDAKGKRRKASGSDDTTKPTAQRRTSASSSAFSTSPSSSAMLATSPTTGREVAASSTNGKRRRSTAGANKDEAFSLSPTSPISGRRRSSTTSVAPRILRAGLDRPVMVAAATVVKEPTTLLASSTEQPDDGVRVQEDGSAKLHVLFGTRAGRLDRLTISLEQMQQSTVWKPVAMSTQYLGEIPQPGGPHGIAYLGEDFVYVASTSGDSTLYKMMPTEVQEVQRWPNLAPILDFVAEDGSSGPSSSLSSSNTNAIKDASPSSTSSSSSSGAQARIVTCSGTGPTGSLRVVRNGVALEDLASLQEPGVRRIWSVADGAGITRLLVLNYPSHARYLTLDSSTGSFEDVTPTFSSLPGLDSPCLLVAGLEDSRQSVHVTEKAVSIISFEGAASRIVAQWTSAKSISCAAATQSGSVLVGTQDAEVISLRVSPATQQLEAVTTVKVAGEPCSIAITATRAGRSAYAAVGLWNPAKVVLLQLSDLSDVTPDTFDAVLPSLPRSVLLHTFATVRDHYDETTPQPPLHLLVGLGDGTLLSFALDLPTESSFSNAIFVTERRTASLGSHPLLLTPIVTSQGLHAVFAACDRPTVLHAEGTRLTYSAVQHRTVVDVASLSTSSTANGNFDGQCLVFALADELRLTQLGAIQKLDIRTIPLGMDNPLAIAQSAAKRELAVATWTFMPEGRQTKIKAGGKVLLFDSETVDQIDEYSLQPSERPNCVEFVQLPRGGKDGSAAVRELLIVGTGTSLPDRKETTEGRILGFEINPLTRKLELVFQKVVRGNVFAVAQVSRFVAAAINSEVVLYAPQGGADDDDEDESNWQNGDDDGDSRMRERGFMAQEEQLVERGRWSAAFTAITLSSPEENLLVVGDALRSLVVLRVKDAAITNGRAAAGRRNNMLVEMARDCDPYWTTAAEQIDAESQTYIGADIAFNLYTAQRLELSSDAQRKRKEAILRSIEAGQTPDDDDVLPHSDGWSRIMERRGAYHYGDLVNKFRRASFVSAAGKTTANSHKIDPRLVFVTAAGAIGVIASLGEREGHVTTQVERNLNEFVEPIGDISAEDWRMLRTDHRVSASAGFIDGDVLSRFSLLDKRDKDLVLQGPKSELTRVDADAAEVGALVEALARLS